MKKIVVGINNLTNVEQPAYGSHIHYFYRLGRSYKDIEFILVNPRRMSIDRMRNHCADIALQTEADGLLFIDDDVILPINSLQTLLDAKADIVAGITYIRGYPFHPMLFKFDRIDPKTGEPGHYIDDYRDVVKEDGLIHCDAVGFSYCLIDVNRVLKPMFQPYFITGPAQTEDVYFCMNAREQIGPSLTIRACPDVQTLHILGHDTIGEFNLEARLRYEEAVNPNLMSNPLNDSKRGDHAPSYFERMGIITPAEASKMAGLPAEKKAYVGEGNLENVEA